MRSGCGPPKATRENAVSTACSKDFTLPETMIAIVPGCPAQAFHRLSTGPGANGAVLVASNDSALSNHPRVLPLGHSQPVAASHAATPASNVGVLTRVKSKSKMNKRSISCCGVVIVKRAASAAAAAATAAASAAAVAAATVSALPLPLPPPPAPATCCWRSPESSVSVSTRMVDASYSHRRRMRAATSMGTLCSPRAFMISKSEAQLQTDSTTVLIA